MSEQIVKSDGYAVNQAGDLRDPFEFHRTLMQSQAAVAERSKDKQIHSFSYKSGVIDKSNRKDDEKEYVTEVSRHYENRPAPKESWCIVM
ncbi:hypothetical protein PoB_003717000 [Plakobranchus ocellatus]|uniref:Uncharacterized protein n=1 Tax=Plakobranchus ocellatus TaxID=259542 RepID=A0AAV4AUT8_9GAST|nr:hypothetical protein PoB_003717000 [Plakobranchus ocellatus]